jgi:hypothetical protein
MASLMKVTALLTWLRSFLMELTSISIEAMAGLISETVMFPHNPKAVRARSILVVLSIIIGVLPCVTTLPLSSGVLIPVIAAGGYRRPDLAADQYGDLGMLAAIQQQFRNAAFQPLP